MTRIDAPADFEARHVGPDASELTAMLSAVGYPSAEALAASVVPDSIRMSGDLGLPEALTEVALLARLRGLASKNQVCRSLLGMGYSDTHVPGVILRNIMENPGWYTQYTPYQAEIAQGRLEALLNFQTMVMDLTGLEIANASLLDEATAAAEALHLAHTEAGDDANTFFVSELCHPQTIGVVTTRAEPLGIDVVVGDHRTFELHDGVFGVLLQYPATDGRVLDYRAFSSRAKALGATVIAATDLMSLALLTPPGEWGADVAVGNSQRFGVPMGFGGPHAAFMAAKESFKRKLPGRIIGVSVDADGNPALRMALQTREQHIRRERATSNICTAQVLLAIMAGAYAVYHGPDGIRAIAQRIRDLTGALAAGLGLLGHELMTDQFFDTLHVRPDGDAGDVLARALAVGINLRDFRDGTLGISLDEVTRPEDLDDLFLAFNLGEVPDFSARSLAERGGAPELPAWAARRTPYLEHRVFNTYHSETEMLRYLHRLESRDLSLNTSMIPLGSCTMKLNATTQMAGVTWPELGKLHPCAPLDQAKGYQKIFSDLESWLAEISGFSATSLQPNSGAQGEYAGLLVIRAYHADRGDGHRNICLIPASAHGTNPASAVMAGMRVVVVKSADDGTIDLDDLEAKATEHASALAAIMVTYPSTHGVFEADIGDACRIVHEHGGLVYLDGANLNAQVGLARPGDYGADVCHINLHKTFAIPHGGGGPGMGPICVNEKLAPFLPSHPVHKVGGPKAIGPVSGAAWGSSSILAISWAYIALLGRLGVRRATEVAILNANYMAGRLQDHFDILYRGEQGLVAHEFIIDLRPLKRASGITEEDVAKRLIDYGFHAPTVSFPVIGTLMIEPTESESKRELDRFCDAMTLIRAEIDRVASGEWDAEDNPLKNAPHTAAMVAADEWSHSYSRSEAAYPAPWTRESKFWPSVRRVDNAYGDRNLMCACPPVAAYT
ncbi:MAG: aminomethyl-transferring glycine dehydrogenase [Gemmatimonadota bacterium]|nr:aminomethyl-transferring glycine dehydrogenase [Gemmatimonadota bacterium]MDH3421700.1 aminomethyl-transferring glycine dehydrogenase [Gemmatimonadota bacterium]